MGKEIHQNLISIPRLGPIPSYKGLKEGSIHVGSITEGEGWRSFILSFSDLKLAILTGSREARASIGASILLKEAMMGTSFTILDTSKSYRGSFKELPKARLYRLGLDSTLNPFSLPEAWHEAEAYNYALIISKIYNAHFNLTKVHASLMYRSLSKLYEENKSPTSLEVAQAIEDEAEPLTRLNILAEELRGS